MHQSPALVDILKGIKQINLAGTLGWQDVKQRYRRSSVGPFWLTISMGVMIATIGLVFGQIFRAPMKDFLPFLAIGLILWGYISVTMTEGCMAFISADAIIKQLPLPLFIHVLRVVWRNLIILAHNIVILPLVLIVMWRGVGPYALLALAGLVVLTLNLLWVSLLLAVLCARFRDIPQIVSSVIIVLFYLTPIMWMPHLLPERAGDYLLLFNPFAHWIEIVRAPILGNTVSFTNWAVSISTAVFGWLAAFVLYSKYVRRIAYWL